MPNLRSIILIAAVAVVPVGAVAYLATRPVPDAPSASIPAALHCTVKGMHCEGCVAAITSKVTKINGVSACTVTIAAETADIDITDRTRTIELQSQITEAVTGLGYTIEWPAK
ncbi:MAG: heavy-metal-associated domain-containing protein [Phycisphaerae bacterium]|nr:heavy-metal-associated domain-containing protein [Phycisphaerae bacterium]